MADSPLIPYARQCISQEDVDAVEAVLRSPWLTQGPAINRFEATVAELCGAEYAVAVNSATAALHIACLALGAGPDDVVWTTPNTFVASANCARYCGASVDFVDIDPRTWTMSAAALEDKLEKARAEGRRLPAIVIPVHFGGQSCDMSRIASLGREFGFRIIEDASHAIGGSYGGAMVGACRHSDVTVFSFHPVKIITTGEGGMALTNDTEVADRMARLRTHGIRQPSEQLTKHVASPRLYEQVELGFNYRITDIQAALGLSQLDRLAEFVGRRNQLARRYGEAFAGLPLRCQHLPEGTHSACHLFVIRVASSSRLALLNYLLDAGIGANIHYIPVHLQPYYRALGFSVGDFPEAEAHYREALSLPMFAALDADAQQRVIDAVVSGLAA
jgi:UDP-4-amino-4,6-dideoxy-N-acetyl-beta-L-altrosamine transaminase